MNKIDGAFETILFGGIGYLAGMGVNHAAKAASPSLFPKAPFADVKAAAILCLAMIALDKFAKSLIESQFGKKESRGVLVSTLRVGASFYVGFAIQTVAAPHFGITPLSLKAAGAVAGAAVLVYAILKRTMQLWNAD